MRKMELFSEDEKREIEENEEIVEAESRMIFNPQSKRLDLSKRRATDLKGNSCFHFQGNPVTFKLSLR